LESGLSIEIAITLFLQSLGDWLSSLMRFFTFLGNEEFYLVIMPAIYWCVDASMGLRTAILLLISGCINTFFKILFHGPRPYWFDSRVRAFISENSFGIPSGHAQNAMSIWGLFTTRIKKNWVLWASGLIIFLIGLSRIYLGVHFLRDVILGWVIGFLLLIGFLRLEKPVLNWFIQKKLVTQLILIFAAGIMLISFSLLPSIFLGSWQIPQLWIQNAQTAAPGILLNPFDPEGVFSSSGAFFGMALGAVWIYRVQGFPKPGTFQQNIGRYVIGLLGVVLFWFVLGKIIPPIDGIPGYIIRYARYTLIGLWITGLAPLVFIKLHLATPNKTMSEIAINSTIG